MPFGKIEPFDVSSHNWDAYCRRVKQFIALNNISEDLHVATLVTHVGIACYELMCDLCSPDLPEDKKFEQLVKIVKDHLEPQRSEIAERHMFRQRKQRQGEIVSDYLKSLKHLAKHCNFRDSLEVNLRDQFVSGLQSEDMRSRLFAERNIDYKRAIELALALEAAERHAAEAASGASSSAISEGLHRIRSSPARAERGRMKRREGAGGVQADAAARAGALSLEGSRRGCWRCGRSGHPPSRCRYKFYSCDSCGQRGHLKVVCGNVDKCSDAVIQKNTKGQLHLADKTPIFVKSRPLPLALRAPVERELERLQRDDVIYKVDRSDYAHYDPKLPLLLSVDSSAYGLGAVLTHRYSDGSERLISCASRTLNEAEQQGCLVWGYRVIIPASLHSAVLDELHSGHIGVVKMKQLARNYLWWSGLDADIERVCRECTACAALRAQPPPAPLHSWEWPVEPWSRLNVDFLGPFRNKYYLVILDAHSKWLEVEPVPNTSAATVISCLRKIFARFGLCKVIVSDNGPPFSSSEYLHYLNKNGIKRILVAPYHPSSNGAAENVVKTVKLVLKKAIIENVNLEKALCTFLFTYRNTEHCTTQKEPSVALLGHRLRGRLDLLRPNTRDVIRDKQSSQEERRGGSLREMSTGDRVLVRNYNNNLVKWKEGVVLDRTGPVSYVVKTDDDNRMVDNENSGEREMNDEAFKSLEVGIKSHKIGLAKKPQMEHTQYVESISNNKQVMDNSGPRPSISVAY
ncbi:uncharacterized protein LOC120629458 [Pararge aegeria]|uniref:uncharacterized protein LOC120629458 n=2 Tax=Pararge aegeria TaxID=116150 RepID=UPI0019CF6936|nr:uncharacterized protein LOC120629458 [Pararge aegeria]